MTISDTLSDAAEAIRSYRRNQPSWYRAVAAELDALLAHMERVRVRLDTPPGIERPEWASVEDAAHAAVHDRIPALSAALDPTAGEGEV